MSEETTVTTDTSTPPTATVASPQPAQGLERTDVFADDGKTWKSKFEGLKGSSLQSDARRRDMQVEFDKQLGQMTATIRTKDSTIAQLNTEIAAKDALIDTIPGLKEQMEALQAEASKADKYRAMMTFPELLSVMYTETTDNGEVTTNPILSLIENSTLEGDALNTMIAQLAGALPSAQTPITPVTTGVIPTPTPVETETVESLQAQADAAHQRANAGEEGALEEMLAIYDKQRKLKQGD